MFDISGQNITNVATFGVLFGLPILVALGFYTVFAKWIKSPMILGILSGLAGFAILGIILYLNSRGAMPFLSK